MRQANMPRLAGLVRVQAVRCVRRWVLVASTAEFYGFEPTNGFALMRDDFSLPNKSYRHHAHHDDGSSNDNALLCFGSRNMKAARDPIHGKGSPSTRPLRCGPHARVAGRRDAASRLLHGQVKGQSNVSKLCVIAFGNQQLRSVSTE